LSYNFLIITKELQMKFTDKVFFAIFSLALIAIIVIVGNYQISNINEKLPDPIKYDANSVQ